MALGMTGEIRSSIRYSLVIAGIMGATAVCFYVQVLRRTHLGACLIAFVLHFNPAIRFPSPLAIIFSNVFDSVRDICQ